MTTMAEPLYILGGAQTDFARNWTREGKGIPELLHETVARTLDDAGVEAADIGSAHVGNFLAETLVGQSHLAGLVVEAEPRLAGIPITRHEAACASGGVAARAALAELAAGQCEVSLVVGVELMRALPAFEAQQRLGAAALVPTETAGVRYPWPKLFAHVGDAYEARHGLERRHLTALSRQAYANAKRNENAQTRGWTLDAAAFADDDVTNPILEGRIRKSDASQVTDGGAGIVVARASFAAAHAARHGISLASLPRIEASAHRTARMTMAANLAEDGPYVAPHVRAVLSDVLARAGTRIEDIDVIECHDCFTTSFYLAIDHFGLTAPGENGRAIDDGTIAFGGRTPMNPSGGLIGLGHPVGATGVRMLLDVARQVSGRAGATQVEGARRGAVLNIGGSTTTTVAFVVARDAPRERAR